MGTISKYPHSQDDTQLSVATRKLMNQEQPHSRCASDSFVILALVTTFVLRYTPFLASRLLFAPFLDNVHIYGPYFPRSHGWPCLVPFHTICQILGRVFQYLKAPISRFSIRFIFFGLINYGGPLSLALYTHKSDAISPLIFYVNLYVFLRCSHDSTMGRVCGSIGRDAGAKHGALC